MRHIVRAITMTIFAVGLAACVPKPAVKPDYEKYTELVRKQNEERQARAAAIADSKDCNGDVTCVVASKAMAMAVEMGGNSQPQIAPPQPKRTIGDRIENIVGIGLKQTVPLAGIYAGIEGGKRNERSQARQYEMLENVTVAGLEAGAAIAQSGPSINVNGNYGDTQTIGNDLISGTRTETNVGGNLGDTSIVETTIGRDQAGRDIIDNNGIIGDNNEQRDNSDGPISDDGDDCSGESCNPVENPVEEETP